MEFYYSVILFKSVTLTAKNQICLSFDNLKKNIEPLPKALILPHIKQIRLSECNQMTRFFSLRRVIIGNIRKSYKMS